jgi:hypothetical protein
VSQQSAGPTVGRVIRARRVAEPTVRRGYQTVYGAPTALNRQRSASPKKERNPHRTVSGGAPDYPVSQRSAGPTVGRVIRARCVAEPTVRRGHRTVRCAPDSVWCANGSGSSTVGCATDGKKSAPDSVRWCTGLSGAPGDRRQKLPSWNALNGS